MLRASFRLWVLAAEVSPLLLDPVAWRAAPPGGVFRAR